MSAIFSNNSDENEAHVYNSSDSSKEESTKISSEKTSKSEEELPKATELYINLTETGLQKYKDWNECELIKLLTDNILKCVNTQIALLQKEVCEDPITEERLRSTVHSGLYSAHVLNELQENGMKPYNILKAMKLGLSGLNCCELVHFKNFGLDPYILDFEHMWIDNLNKLLIENLKLIGLKEIQAWHIIVFGVASRTRNILCHLALSGIDVPGILSWQSPIMITPSKNIIKYLRKIGVAEDVVELVEKYNINEEILEMLIEFGYKKSEITSDQEEEESVCECLTSRSNISSSSDIGKESSDSKLQLCGCQCYQQAQKASLRELCAKRNDYLRRNVMVPLAWAMGKALKYGPTSPQYYTAYQLLRWSNDSIPQVEKDDAFKVVALATIKMDQKLIMQALRKKEEQVKEMNEMIMENIPCEKCKKHQESWNIKKPCWKCSKTSENKYDI